MRPQDVVPTPQYPPQVSHYLMLEVEPRTHIGTEAAAFYLNRKEQTLRMWACYENGPIRPVRVNKRLAWSVAEIRTLLASGG